VSTTRSLLFLALTLAGYALIIPGQLATFNIDEAAIWAAVHLGDGVRWLVNQSAPGLPPGAVMAVSCIVLGTVLVAVGVAVATDPISPSSPGEGSDTSAGFELVWQPLVVGVVLAAATAYFCLIDPPSNLAVLTWVASMAAGLVAFVEIDRRRGITLRRPFADRREVVVVLALTAFCLIVVVHDLTGWRWSGTPDESNFFGVAQVIAAGESNRFLLSERGVFEVHPTLSSVYQGIFMWLFGATGFSWRLSSAAALVMSLPALYVLARLLWNRRVATVATLLFGTTPLAVGFAHLGYNNTQIYPVLAGSLALMAWAHWNRSAALFYLAACLAGLGFYTYYPARLSPVLVLWFGLCLRSFALRGAGRDHLAAVALASAFTLLPVALHPQETLRRMFQFTTFTGGGAQQVSDLAAAWQLISGSNLAGIVRHAFVAVTYSVYFAGPHHFQWPPVVDPISGPLVLVGLLLCLAGFRWRNARFVACAYVLSAVLVCATSHYYRPPLTRLLFLSPFAALLAAIALDRLASGLSRATGSFGLGQLLAGGLTVAAMVWAIGAVQYNIRHRYHGYGDGTTAELVRLALDQPADTQFVYVQRVDTSMWSVDDIFGEYGMKERLQYKQGFDDSARRALESVQPPFMVALALGKEDERVAAEGLMTRRFPGEQWNDSDPGKVWNLRYLEVRASK